MLNLSVFSQKEMETIHELSLEYLQNHGFHLNHEGGIEILAAAGAEITDAPVSKPVAPAVFINCLRFIFYPYT